MAKSQSETRRFGMAPELLLDVIKRQAGTPAKAVLELVMNAVDAGATRCEVTLTTAVLEKSSVARH